MLDRCCSAVPIVLCNVALRLLTSFVLQKVLAQQLQSIGEPSAALLDLPKLLADQGLRS